MRCAAASGRRSTSWRVRCCACWRIACVNLSNLLLARINVRRQEFAVRVALGARPRHLIEQALAESLAARAAGRCVGVPLAIWATHALAGLQTFGVPLLQNASVDPLALGVTVALTALAGIACGVLPAWHLSRVQGRSRTPRTSAPPAVPPTLARSALVVVEVALACVLLVGAGLLIRSFGALLQRRPRVPASARDGLARRPAAGIQQPCRRQPVSRRHRVRSVAALPGVEAVGLSDVLPLGRNRTWGIRAKGVEVSAGTRARASSRGSSISTTCRPCRCRSAPAATSTTAISAAAPRRS